MKNYAKRTASARLRMLLTIVIILGIALRFINLDRKVYWHDEVYTSMRAAGFTRGAIDQELFQNKIIPAPSLQKFQQIKPGSTVADTINSLKVEDPQHPPLYFLMARFWMQIFGGSLTASRLLPALLSLFSLPLMYKLAIELFDSQRVAWMATALLAISPFDILFAQTARQYGLLTTLIIGSSLSLLRSLRHSHWKNWAVYGISVALGLYTHPFFALTLIGQGVFVILNKQPVKPHKGNVVPRVQGVNRWLGFASAIALALLLYAPWIQVLYTNAQRAADTTDWARIPQPFSYLAKLWTLSFTSLFIDLDFGFDNSWNFLLRIPFIILILSAFYFVYRRTSQHVWLFILTSVFVPFLLLALPDLLIGGKRSAVSRYLISCYPGIQLAVAYLLAIGLTTGKVFWRSALALVLTASVISCGTSVLAETWWNKDLSYDNATVSRLVNAEAAKNPVLASDIGDDFTNTGDLISLSYRLKDNVRLFLMSRPTNFDAIAQEPEVLLFRPSNAMREAIAQKGWRLQEVSAPGRLWRLIRSA
ncbi:MAG: phospholipid carrier-dependent glycosyltransferase [Leptolyngbyaceae cyanobacterium CSU_1_4]|nr:phospholipid carrier-dependent glycosyltransferase [Leptolyngbyaceae cyanobacterium CSU_1_4]